MQAQHSGLIIHLEAAPNYKILDDIQDGAIDIGVVTTYLVPVYLAQQP
ncbi:protein of unknown function,might belong to LysR family transcriptional regulator [Shewanella benthica]|uniref:Uncharacterized protein n=1 Tax=Shewanella benthica TaxID=43661 RepID=A0A330M443_9GAMM|nr:protein of unknown function,might belong to LysR family transcriptional regulator [Shewanella benthica]